MSESKGFLSLVSGVSQWATGTAWVGPAIRIALMVIIIGSAWLKWVDVRDDLIEQGRVLERASQQEATNQYRTQLGEIHTRLTQQADSNDEAQKRFKQEVEDLFKRHGGRGFPTAQVVAGKCVPDPSAVRTWNELQTLLLK
jgi:hypothetical protein